MVRTKVVAAVLLCIIIAMGIGSWFLLQSIKRLEQYAAQLEIDIDKMTNQIADLQTQLRKSEIAYQDLKSEHDNLSFSHDVLQIEYGKLSEQYESLSEEYESLETRYAAMYDSRYEEGYDDGYIKGLETTGYDIINPTYNEALQFIRSDRTDRNEYVEGEYVCWNFAGDFKNNAFEAGYRCGFVYIEFREGAHGIVCFNCTDKGIIFIEPQDDDIVTLIIGQHYWDRSKYRVTYDDTIVRFGIIW